MNFYDKQFQSTKLENGLSIITRQDNNSDIVTLSFWVKAGARYERKHELGYAHLLEHMILKGTKNFPSPFKIGYAVDRAGAFLNASTGAELISVYIQVAKHEWQEMFKLLCDIILNPIFQKGIFENEKKVVLQEIKKTYDNPNSYLWMKTIRNIFEGHPLSHHPSGNKEDIENATIENLIAYRDQFFTPDNIILIISGAVNNEELIKLAEQQFAGFIKKEHRQSPANFPALKIKQGTGFENFNSNQSYLSFNFVGPQNSLKDFLTLQLIANFLGSLRTSLLYQELRQKEGIVYNVNAYNIGYQDANLFHIATSSSLPDKVIPIVVEKSLNLENYFSADILKEYQEQYINILIRQLSDPMIEIKFLSNYWLLYDKLITLIDVADVVKTIIYDDLINVKNKYLSKNNLFIMQLGKGKTV